MEALDSEYMTVFFFQLFEKDDPLSRTTRRQFFHYLYAAVCCCSVLKRRRLIVKWEVTKNYNTKYIRYWIGKWAGPGYEEDWRNLFPGEADYYVTTTSVLSWRLYQCSTISRAANTFADHKLKDLSRSSDCFENPLSFVNEKMALSSRALCTRLLKKVFVILQNYYDAAQISN